MLDNIKSIIIMKKFFTYLNEEIILKIIKYNKRIQRKINISLIDFKLISGKYIIYESNKLMKEYNSFNDELLFEGEYLSGKKNGKGKEYFYNELIFEGEYKNGKRNGKGKEFDSGQLIFEGEYLNGKKWTGIGYHTVIDNNLYKPEKENNFFFEYNDNYDLLNYKKIDEKENVLIKNVIYELKDGKGLVKEYNGNKLIFEGEYLNGEKNGKGKEYNRNGNLIFEGEYLNGKRWNGLGYDTKNNLIYKLKSGKGFVKEYYLNNLLKFEGEYLNGERNGKGKEYYSNGNLEFEGNYRYNKRNGQGKEYNYNGNLKFEGEYLYNYKIRGKEYNKGILEYEGEFLFHKKWNGKGFDEKGNIVYELNNGNGKVKYYDSYNNLFFEGEYLNGKRNGRGKEYDEFGKLIFEGEYLNEKNMEKERNIIIMVK